MRQLPGLDSWPLLSLQAVVVPSLEETPEQGAEEAIVELKVNFDYLLSMPISSLTLEKVSPQVFIAHTASSCGAMVPTAAQADSHRP